MDDLDNLFILKDGLPLSRPLLKRGIACRWRKGAVIPPKGGVYYIESGLVIVRRTLVEGQSKALFIAKENHFFHDIAYAQQHQGLTEVSSLCLSYGWYFSPELTEELLAGVPEFRRSFLFSLACKGRTMGADLTFLACLPGHRRLLFIMENIADRMDGTGCGPREVHLSQSELAEYLGLHRVTVTRLLQELESEGLIARRDRKIWLLDRPGSGGSRGRGGSGKEGS